MTSPVNALRRVAGRVTLFAKSPRAFSAAVAALRAVGLIGSSATRSDETMRRIFVAHPYSSVGDLVLLIPLLEKLGSVWPEAEIHVAVSDRVTDLLGAVPRLRCLPMDDLNLFQSGMNNRGRPLRRVLDRYTVISYLLGFYRRKMDKHPYDLAIAPRWGSNTTWPAIYLAYLSGAPRIIGYSGSVDGGSTASDQLLTTAARGGAHEHETIRNLALLTRAGVLESIPHLADVVDRPIPSLLALASSTPAVPAEEPYAVIAPGANVRFRRWSPENLTAVMQQLHRHIGLHFCLVGGAADAPLCRALAASLPGCATSRAGQTGLRQLVSLLADARLFIGMDSGIAHIAGALGVPTIVISPFPSSSTIDHFNSPVRFRPCGPRVRVLQPLYPLPPCNPTCSAADSHCILQITSQDVFRVAGELMQTAAIERKDRLR